MPISKWLDSNSSTQVGQAGCRAFGVEPLQARVLAHPKYFMQESTEPVSLRVAEANCVRMFVASADPTFHRRASA